jgi:NADPH:quinone reductase-like Zn-dependent oxidoreductase
MKVIQIDQFGGSEQIRINTSPVPVAHAHEVLVRVHDAGVNPVDWKIREGFKRDSSPTTFPLTLGQDFSGEIIRAGVLVEDFTLGDRIIGFAPHGAYAEFVAVPADRIALLDDSIDDKTGAALPTAGLTAYQLIEEVSQLKAGQTILIHGASGAVGSVAVQLAASRGAKVIANASREDQTYLLGIGVSEVIDHDREKFEDRLQDVDVVLDLVGEETAKRSLKVLKKNGILASTVGAAKKLATESLFTEKQIKAIDFVMRPDGDQLAHLVELVKDGTVKIRMAKTFPLDQAKQAQELSQHGHVKGKIVLHVQ